MYNGHADVAALLDTNGNIVATYYYDAFGNILEKNGTADNSILYGGYQYDEETGLYYLNARMYDPITDRFLQEDTYKGQYNDPLSLNLYTYCHNEPLMYSDPTGHAENFTLMDAFAIIDKYFQQIDAILKEREGKFLALTVGDFTAEKIQATVAAMAVAFAESNIEEIYTGINPMRDILLGGNQELYDGVQGTVAALGFAAISISAIYPAPRNSQEQANVGTSEGTSETAGKAGNEIISQEKHYTPDQQTLIELAKEVKKNGGTTLDEANTLLRWADEYNVPAHGPEIHPERSGATSNILHFHIGKTGHIPIN